MKSPWPNFAGRAWALERNLALSCTAATLIAIFGFAVASALMKQRLAAQFDLMRSEEASVAASLRRATQEVESAAATQRLVALDAAAKTWLNSRQLAWDEPLRELERLSIPGVRMQRLLVDAEAQQIEIGVLMDGATSLSETMAHLNGSEDQTAPWQVHQVQRVPGTSTLSVLILRQHISRP